MTKLPAFVSKCSSKLFSTSKMTEDYSHLMFKSLDSVLEHLNKPEFHRLSAVKDLLNIYNSVVTKSDSKLENKKFPLVVLEGLDGCGKSTQSKRLTNDLKAELCCTPPACIKPIREQFDSPEYKEVRTAYYALGNYIAALEISEILQDRPVVLDRFWHSTTSYAIAQAIADNPEENKLPPEKHDIYNWPEDLLKPDYIGFLCVREDVRLQRIKNRPELTAQENLLRDQEKFRSDVLAVYNRIIPKFHPVNAQLSKRKVSEQVLKEVKPLLPEGWILD